MIEGQEGVTWPQWQEIAAGCERHGVPALFRSDHYMNLDGEHLERGSLDALGTLVALGAQTTTLRLGTMVSPATFRHPSELAKLAVTADHVSGGRFSLGLGAGWHEREHEAYGFEYYDVPTRVERFAEQAEIVRGNWSPGPFSFSGKHYELVELDAQPKPLRGTLPLIMGGAAGPKVTALAARFADEYNTVFATPAVAAERKARVDAACETAGREPLPFSVMTAVTIGTDEADLRRRLALEAPFRGMDPDQLLREPPEGWIIATIDHAAEQLQALAAVGVSRVMCQHMPHEELPEFIELLGTELAPCVR